MNKGFRRGMWASVAGTTRFEFLMQIRRKAVWITLLLFGLLSFTGAVSPWQLPESVPLTKVVADWAMVIQAFMPIAFGLLLANRVPRDRSLGVEEVLDTLPAYPGARLAGKYLGGTLATIVPLFVVYTAGVCFILIDRGEFATIPLGLAAFLAINLPGLLFVAAFSVAVPAVLWVPLYQFLFVGYWFWGNVLNPDFMPTLSGTWLAPLGGYAANGLFGAAILYSIEATAWGGVVSIVVLLVLTASALYIAHRYLRRHQAQQ